MICSFTLEISSKIFLISGLLTPNSGTSLTAASTALTPPLNAGSSGCTSASPFEASGLVGFGASPSGFAGVGGVVSFTPPVNSGKFLVVQVHPRLKFLVLLF